MKNCLKDWSQSRSNYILSLGGVCGSSMAKFVKLPLINVPSCMCMPPLASRSVLGRQFTFIDSDSPLDKSA